MTQCKAYGKCMCHVEAATEAASRDHECPPLSAAWALCTEAVQNQPQSFHHAFLFENPMTHIRNSS